MGIRTVLTLYSQPGPTRYELEETYLGTKDGDRSFTNSGRWTVLRGSTTDVDATVYQIDFDRADRTRNFLRDGDYYLTMLDRQQAPLPSSIPQVLLRVPTEAKQPVVLTESDSTRPVRVRQGQWIIFRFPSNPSTGFRWIRLSDADKGLQSRGGLTYVRDNRSTDLGATGSEIWSVSAEGIGEHRIQFVYGRPWESRTDTEKKITFILDISR
jgi:inhibitor of cysteine peptidase